MKRNSKQPSPQDVIKDLYLKRLYIVFALFAGLIIALGLNAYKKMGPYIMKVNLKEQYFPIEDDLKHNLKYDIINTFKDKNDLLKNVKNQELKEKIDQGHIYFDIENQNNVVGTKNVNVISINVMARLDNKENYNNYKLFILELIKDINSNAENKIIDVYKEEFSINKIFIEKSKNFLNKELFSQTQLEENNKNYEKLKILVGELNLNNQKQNEIEKVIMILESDKFEHLKIYPTNPSFEENKLSTKNFIYIIMIFALGSVLLITLNRFV